MTVKFTYEDVYNYFKELKCELLETEYINCKTQMKYRCKCGNESKINFDSFKNKRGQGCIKCVGKEKHNIKSVKETFKKHNCELLETEYINNSTKMKYRCKCGNESQITFQHFQKGVRCMKCSGNERLTYENVKIYFEEQNCELLETEYINAKTKMKYRCKCNNIDYVNYDNFVNGCRCNTCRWDKCKETNLERYGCEYPMQNVESFLKNKKSNYKSKVYEFKNSDRVEKVQGYEPQAIDYLLENGIQEEDIVVNVKEMPKFNYISEDEKPHRYYPDIYVKSQNKVIEVKSEYTYKKELEKNQLKKACVEKLDVKFEFWIITVHKKNITIRIL